MTRLSAVAPCRVDLAGGTLDLWPLGLFLERAVTVNVAVDVRTGCTIETGGDRWSFALRDGGESWSPAALDARPELSAPPAFALAAVAAAHFGLPPSRVETWSDAPRGSGLGASSALMIALIAACARWAGRELSPRESVDLACNLETRILKLPAGTQDHWSARCGSGSLLEHGAEGTTRTALPADLNGLARSLVVADTRVSHHSGQNNWTVFRAFLEGDEVTRSALAEVGRAAAELADVLRSPLRGDGLLAAAGAALGREWEARKRLSPAVSCPEVEAVVRAAAEAGGAAKVCGAGGGGCVVCLPGTEAGRDGLERAVERTGARVLELSVSPEGVRVDEG